MTTHGFIFFSVFMTLLTLPNISIGYGLNEIVDLVVRSFNLPVWIEYVKFYTGNFLSQILNRSVTIFNRIVIMP
jgi:hypothetical protein